MNLGEITNEMPWNDVFASLFSCVFTKSTVTQVEESADPARNGHRFIHQVVSSNQKHSFLRSKERSGA